MISPRRVLTVFERLLTLVLTIAVCFLFFDGTGTYKTKKPTKQILKPHDIVLRSLAGGEEGHNYEMALNAQQYLSLTVEQMGVDVIVELFDPFDKKLIEKDGPLGNQSEVLIYLITETSGKHRLTISVPDKAAPSGKYRIQIKEWRLVVPEDSSRLKADQAYEEGERLRTQGTHETLLQAISRYEIARDLWESIGDISRVNALTGLGAVYTARGKRRMALEYYLQALPLWLESGDTSNYAVVLNNVGLAYIKLGQVRKALRFFADSLPLRRAIRDRRGEAITLHNTALAYDDLGERQKSLNYYEKALPLWRSLNHEVGEAYTLNNMGTIYRSLGESQTALDYLLEALSIRQRIGRPRETSNTLTNIGTVYSNMGNYEKALDILNQALPIAEQAGFQTGIAATYDAIGEVYTSLGDLQEGANYYELALKLSEELGEAPRKARALSHLGDVYFNLRKTEKARSYFQQSHDLFQSINNPVGEANSLYKIAQVERQLGNQKKALQLIKASIRLSESLRARIANRVLQTSYFESVQDYYDFYISLLIQFHHDNPNKGYAVLALHAAEQARTRTLLETLAQADVDMLNGVDSKLVERDSTLKEEINAKERQRIQLHFSGKQQEAEELEAEIRKLLSQYQEIESQIRETSPEYVESLKTRPIKVEDIQRHVLDATTTLLQYWLGKEQSFLWVVTQNAIQTHELPSRRIIEKAARKVYPLLSARNQIVGAESSVNRGKVAQDLSAAFVGLSRLIFGPALGELLTKRLLVVSDGALQFIPFAALPMGSAELQDSNAERQLIDKYEIVSVPSASVLAFQRQRLKQRKSRPKTIALFADPVFVLNDPRVKRIEMIADKNASPVVPGRHSRAPHDALERSLMDTRSSKAVADISRLIFSRREAEAIMSQVPKGMGMKALDFQANRTTATNVELSQYRFLHFATHGLLNSIHPELSGIVLSLVDENGKPIDGFLRLHDIYNLKLPADLVVLSSCQTALGKEIRGEGLIGLTRGFMYAGASRVVASLWKVDDEATSEFMRRFYTGMLGEKQLSPAAALRMAQMEIREIRRWKSPYYWAAFVLQGEWQ